MDKLVNKQGNPAGTLRVRVKEARDIKAKGCYIVLGVNNHEAKSDPGTLNGGLFMWNERFDFVLPSNAPTCMKFLVHDISKKQLIGSCVLDYEKLLRKGSGVAEKWYAIFSNSKQSGDILVVMEFIPKEDDPLASRSPVASSPYSPLSPPPLATPPASPSSPSPSTSAQSPFQSSWPARTSSLRGTRSVPTEEDMFSPSVPSPVSRPYSSGGSQPRTATSEWSSVTTPRTPTYVLETPRTPAARRPSNMPSVSMDFEKVYTEILSSRPGTSNGRRGDSGISMASPSMPANMAHPSKNTVPEIPPAPEKTDYATPAAITALLADLTHDDTPPPRPSTASRRVTSYT
mmetsp:Transcript_220/g.440  ORF Transcript_220/g.440 Transcript_220/m.440 type:complete len:345 (-) Transcript_220:475-1509(-)